MPAKLPVTPERDAAILEMRGRLVPWDQIAGALKLNRSTVIQRARCLGIKSTRRFHPIGGARPGPKPRCTPEAIEAARAMRAAGKSYREIGEALGIAMETARRMVGGDSGAAPLIAIRPPLPAGHPETWGRIASGPYPHALPERLRA